MAWHISLVPSVTVNGHAFTGKSRCFAFIVYKEPADLQKCFAQTEHAINSKKASSYNLDSVTMISVKMSGDHMTWRKSMPHLI